MKDWKSLAQWLEQGLRTAAWGVAGPLPSVRSLARERDASAPTVLLALRHLLRKGLVKQMGAAGRYFPADAPAPPPARAPALPRDRRVADALRQQILLGRYRRGQALPARKQLAAAQGCAPATVTRAIRLLEAEGWVRASGAGYLPVTAAPPRRRGAGIHLAGTPNLLQGYQSHAFHFIQTLEREINAMGWGELRLFLERDPVASRSAPADGDVAGFIYLAAGGGRWGEYFARRPRIPLVFVDLQNTDRSDPPPPAERWLFPGHRSYFRLVPTNFRAGRDLALHLRESGHRRVGFFTHIPLEAGWIRERIRGLQSVFGAEGRLEIFQVPEAREGSGAIAAARGGLDAMGRALDLESRTPREIRNQLLRPGYAMESFLSQREAAKPGLQRARSDPNLTAWVCVNDDLALAAWEFLERERARGRSVPALAAFDNSPASYGLGFTSYDFNLGMFAHLALRCLERPQDFALAKRAFLEVAGQLIVRPSTAEAPRARKAAGPPGPGQ